MCAYKRGMRSVDISLIIPAYNEESAVFSLIQNAKKTIRKYGLSRVEILFVDDGSKDRTRRIVAGLKGVRLLLHPRNLGKGVALSTAFKHAKGRIFITIDADNSYPPESIPLLIDCIKQTGSDVVIGSRRYKRDSSTRPFNYCGNLFFSKLVSVITNQHITDASSGMRAFTRRSITALHVKSHGLSWEVEMTTRAARAGLKIIEVPISYYKRTGQSKLNILKDGAMFLFAIFRGRFL